MGRRHQTHRRGGGHRPEAADGDPQQQTAQQEKRQRITAKSDHQAGDYLQYGKEHQHPAAIDRLRVAVAISRPVTNATSAVAVTACPAILH